MQKEETLTTVENMMMQMKMMKMMKLMTNDDKS